MVQLQDEHATRDEEMKEQMNDDRSSVDHHLVEVNEVEIPPYEQQQRGKIIRSKEAKKRRNKKRNNKIRQHRFQFSLRRPYYYKIKSRLSRKILKHYVVRYRHIKRKNDYFVTGVHTDEDRHEYERSLLASCFNRGNYERFRR